MLQEEFEIDRLHQEHRMAIKASAGRRTPVPEEEATASMELQSHRSWGSDSRRHPAEARKTVKESIEHQLSSPDVAPPPTDSVQLEFMSRMSQFQETVTINSQSSDSGGLVEEVSQYDALAMLHEEFEIDRVASQRGSPRGPAGGAPPS